ncbi:MAG: gliding motility-associated C-terminal domain-containing protein [Bacteroidales bacterium]|nr:gliding motility-associated C-terminal domain-containing protein [Bacteroidales bacterium]
MKRNALFILLLIFTGSVATAQNQANIWYFGDYCGVDFNTGIPVNTHEIHHGGDNANAVMCDTNGNFLFSYDVKQVLNRNGEVMPNGENFIGDSRATMGALIVQQPGSDHLYYLFTVDYDDPMNPDIGMHYSVVDMNLDGGLGDVTSEKNIALDRAWAASNKLTSVRHANGEDVWIITRNFKTDQWYVAFLLSASGLDTEGEVSHVPERNDKNCQGSMKVSPNKKYLVAAYETCSCQDYWKTSLDVCTFNAESGEIELMYTLTKNTVNISGYEPWAVEFSPDSKLLYVSYFNDGAPHIMELYQYDMAYIGDSLQFKQSERYIASGPTQGLQLARDGKIYCTLPKAGGMIYDYLSIIHEPWKRGTACNYQADAFYLDDRQTHAFLPNMLLDHLYRFEWDGECARHAIAFQPNFLPEPESILWNFGDLQSSTELWPVHYYQNGGEYEVYVTVTYPSGRVEETSRVITIMDSPSPDLGPDQLICEGEETVLTAGDDEGFYAWSTGSIGNNVFSITVSDSGTYWVKVINDLGCSLSDTIHVGWYDKVVFNEDNLLITPTSCGGSSGSIVGLKPEGFNIFSYTWYDGNGNTISTSLDIFNLAVGNYFLHVIDGHGCTTISDAYTITDAGDIDILEVMFNSIHCDQENGSIQITAGSGAGTDLLFSIDNGNNWQTDNVFTDLPAGNYFVKVGDQGDCETVFENNPVVIANIEGPEINSVSTTPETDYSADGQIDISATVSEGDVFYSIDNGSSFQTNNGLFTGLSAGTYFCIVKDGFGCDTIFTIVLDRIFSQVIDAIAGDGYTCIGNATVSPLLLNNFTGVYRFEVVLTYDKDVVQCDGYIQVHPELESGFQASIIPALGEVHINWQGETPITLPENAKMAELVFSGLNEGVSQVDWVAEPDDGQFFNENGEEIAVNYELGSIRIYTRPQIIMMGSEQSVCEGDTVVISPLAIDGTGDIDYLWDGPDNFSSNGRRLVIMGINANQDGNYQLTVTDTIDCVESKTIDISVNPFPEIAFANYDTIWTEPGYLLEAGNGAEYYLWNTGEITEAIQIDSMGHYVVEVISYEGCKATDAVQILWGEGTPFYLPNAFTPNGDGLNDIFKAIPKYDYVSKYQLTIYNRWGQQIFECNDIDCGWDGNYNGKASPNGAYIYKIIYEEISRPGQSKTLEGTVVLVR